LRFFDAVEAACRREGVAFEFDGEDLFADGPMEDGDGT
jgi:hypothetical protein